MQKVFQAIYKVHMKLVNVAFGLRAHPKISHHIQTDTPKSKNLLTPEISLVPCTSEIGHSAYNDPTCKDLKCLSIREWVKQTVVHLYYGIVGTNKKEQIVCIFNKFNKFPWDYSQ